MALKTFKTFLEEERQNLQELLPALAAIPALLGSAGAKVAAFAGTKAGAAVLSSAAGSAAERAISAVTNKKPQMQSAGQSQEAGTIQNVSVGGSRGTIASGGSMGAPTDGKPVGTTNRSPLAGSPADMAARGFPQQPGRNIARMGAY
jgi:hypothetical protein